MIIRIPMNKNILLYLVIFPLLSNCHHFSYQEINAISQPQTLRFESPATTTPHNLQFRLRAQTDGGFILTINDEHRVTSKEISLLKNHNDLDTIYSFEWYSTVCWIDYEPINVRKGNVAMAVAFDYIPE
ncbi:MAG: hypothetical protein AAF960_05625 [Bacteroidota bacterium]